MTSALSFVVQRLLHCLLGKTAGMLILSTIRNKHRRKSIKLEPWLAYVMRLGKSEPLTDQGLGVTMILKYIKIK